MYVCMYVYTWRRTSASLNYERFHGHQVKFYTFTPKVGSKYTYIILEALMWSQQMSSSVKPT